MAASSVVSCACSGVVTWFWVLEFQTESGDGWPHWHLLIDLSECGGFLDLKRCWRLWRDKWGLGGLDLSHRETSSPEHAIMYATKYLTKTPEASPIWVLMCGRAIRYV